jgi:signal transduction histidine kinase
MPRLLGMLRTDAGAPGLAPQPGLGDLPDLVERVRESGVSAELELSGPTVALAPGLELAAYRVVQEALTNTIKHAHASRAQVLVEFKPDELRVEVVDDGRGAQADGSSGGHGLVGMRERVRLYEGVLTAAPRQGEGYAVSARFPLTERSR